MGYLSGIEISASGMTAQKVRMETVAINLANANTTRTTAGGPFRKLVAVIGERLLGAGTVNVGDTRDGTTGGVQVLEVIPTMEEPRRVFEPAHPDADSKGYVAYPNINPVTEMIDLMDAKRAYAANVHAVNAAKAMAMSALKIGENS